MLRVGHRVNQGRVIGQMSEHMNRGVLEIELRRSENGQLVQVGGGNSVTTNPAPFFDLSGMASGFLHREMSNFFERNAAGALGRMPTPERDVRYARNLDLDDGEVYLRKLIEYIFHRYHLAAIGLTMDDVLQWCEIEAIATVRLFGRTHIFLTSEAYEAHGFIMPFGIDYDYEIHEGRIENDRLVIRPATHIPLETFQWNEPSDHWFYIQSAVQGAGGMVRFFSNFVSVSIFGVDVRFYSDQDGVKWGNHSDVKVRADTFYSTIVYAATEIIFLGGHPGFDRFDAYHMHVSMFVSPRSRFYNHVAFSGEDSNDPGWGNVRFASISGVGQPRVIMAGHPPRPIPTLFAESRVNNQNYLDRNYLRFLNHLHTGTGMVQQLFDAHDYFYRFHRRRFAWNGFWTNSTSVTIGLVNAVGLDHGLSAEQQARATGFDNAILAQYFGR